MKDNIINREKEDAEETATPPVKEEETKEVENEDSEEAEAKSNAEEESNEESEIDYKGELEKKQGNAEHNREGYDKRKGESHTVIDKEGTQKLIATEVAKAVGQVTKQNALMIAKSLSRSEDETELTMWHYENSIMKSGDIHEDIENAHFLANKKRYANDVSEARRSAVSAESKSRGGGPGTKRDQELPKAVLTDAEKKLKVFGISEAELLKAKEEQG